MTTQHPTQHHRPNPHARTIAEALLALTDGLDVVVVAHPASVAFDIADEIHYFATELGLACEMNDANDLVRYGEVPVVVTRPFGWVPEQLPSWRRKPKVVVDGTARFDRAGEWALSKREREVFA